MRIPIVDATARRGERVGCLTFRQEKQSVKTAMLDVKTALSRLVADSQANGRFDIEFYDDLPINEIPSDIQTIVFPIVKELLDNACRHSKSPNILVGLGQDEECICIQVQDWGVGFAPEAIQPHKTGLRAIQQLVQWYGGTMNIDSQCGVGTCVIVEISRRREKPSHKTTDK